MNKSNNDIMWDCFVDIMKGEKSKETEDLVDDFINNYYENDGEEVKYNFSHDNWTLVLCWLHRFDKDKKSKFPFVGHHTLHPMRFIKFLWMKHSFIFFPLRLITLLEIIIAHKFFARKTAAGEYHTSGLLIDFYVTFSYEQKIVKKILDKLMLTMFSSWEEVFRIYHGNPTHYNHKVYLTYLDTVGKNE